MERLKKILKISEKGQAFSTFQLLIAAVVALALLGVLMPIIMQALGFIQSDPVSAAKTTLRSAYDSPGTIQTTEAVTFSERNKEVSAEGIAEGTGIGYDQIFFFTNGFDVFNIIGYPNKDFGNVLTYDRSERVTYYLNIMCTSGAEMEDLIKSRQTRGDISEDEDMRNLTDEVDNHFGDGQLSGVRVCGVFPTRAN